MAARRRTNSYRTYSSGAYAPVYDGNAVRAPQRRPVEQPKPKVRPKRRPAVRPQVEVRQAGQVSVFAVGGFLAVGILAVLLVLSYVQLFLASNSVVALRGQLSVLQEENAVLTAQYEQVFDMEHLQQAVGGTMIRPTQDQIVYIDLSEPDTVILYDQTQQQDQPGLLDSLEEFFSEMKEYFG